MNKVLAATLAGATQISRLALAGALSFAVAIPVHATESRVNALSAGTPAGVFNEKSVTLRDSANIYPLPQYMVTYKNSVDVDTTAVDAATVGGEYGTMNIRYALSDDSVLLLFGKKSPWRSVEGLKSIGGKDVIANSGYAPGVDDPTKHQFGIGFGMKGGESLRLGATLALGGHRNDGSGTAPIDENSNTFIDFAAGIGFDVNETNNLDFGINLGLASINNRDAKGASNMQDRYIGDGANLHFSLIGKGEFQVHQIAKLVPYLRFGYDGRGVAHVQRSEDVQAQNGNDAKRAHLTHIAISLGSDLRIEPVEGVTVQPGLGLMWRQTVLNGNSLAGPPGSGITEKGVENSRQFLPYYGFAAEAKAFDWCVLRLGARQTIEKTDEDNTLPAAQQGQPQPSNERHVSTVRNEVTTGVGIKMMGWDLDVNMKPDFFNNGIHAATGNPTGGWGLDWALGYDW
ncbi:MAG: hypothetical protein EXR79_05150 [Myxococcales bacterium]|nr:hypothetical protein [Myxococcales bacterium]